MSTPPLSTTLSTFKPRLKDGRRPGSRIAAIDVGSNAIRLVIGECYPSGEIRVLKKFREAVRLGKDTFSKGSISKKCAVKALEAFEKFKVQINAHRVESVRAVATSALREAENRSALVRLIAQKTGVNIEVIDGREEGRLIFSAVAHKTDLNGKRTVLIDIGGGSVELTVTDGPTIRASQSFPLGTVRLLEALNSRKLKEKHLPTVIAENFLPVRSFLQTATKGRPIDFAIGTGGNFECLGKLRVALLSKTSIHTMTHDDLFEVTDHLAQMTVKQRIQFLRLKEDRADVIVPAGLTALAILEAIPTETLHIPFVGLRDGLLASMTERP